MEAVFPAAASALARGRRARTPGQRARRRTLPVTFAEIKEVDEGSDDEGRVAPAPATDRERRRPDVLDDQLARFADFRRRRARPCQLSERNEELCVPTHAAAPVPAQLDDPAQAAALAQTAAPVDAAAPSELGSVPHLSDT